MPKPRNKENKGLPLRWRRIRDVYYYDVPQGLEPKWENKKLFRLGKSINEASQVWIQRMSQIELGDEIRTIGQLLDRYAVEVIPTKSVASQASNHNQLPMIRGVFGHMPLTPFKPQQIYRYVENRSRKITDPVTGKVKGGRSQLIERLNCCHMHLPKLLNGV